METPDRQMAATASSAPIVAFDFDGTLTVRDSFTAFLRWRAGPAGYASGLAALAPAAVRWLVHRDFTRLKSDTVRVFLKGVAASRLDEEAEAFADTEAAALFRPDALDTWRRHREAGARLVIVTASPEPVVAPFARRLGADLLIGSRLVYDESGRVGSSLAGRNCRGPEKVRRLREAFGEDVRLAAAYGDTDGDREMLAMADEGFLRVFTQQPTT